MHPLHRFCWLFPVSLSIAACASLPPGVTDEARAWFVTHYAPLWEDLDEADPDKIKAFWVDGFRDHPVDADSSIWENTTERWQRNLERYETEGLTGSTLVRIEVEEINDRAVMIRTRWKDRGEERDFEEPYCGTFIAGKFQREWRFTNYFTVDCATS